MALSTTQILDSTRITRLIQDQATRYANTLPLRFLDRLPLVPADDDEIMARITAKNYAADLVADGQAAAVYSSILLTFVTNTIPNIKDGQDLGQGLLQRLDRIAQNLGTTDDMGYFRNWESATAERSIRNVRERMNILACAMMLDTYAYSKNGLTVNIASWGCPSDLKVTPSTLWTNTAATPITDINTLVQHAANTYGEVYDRITISRADLNNAFATTEFKTLIAGLSQIAAPLAVTNFNNLDPRFSQFFSSLVGLEVEVEDKNYNIINADATQTSGRVLPLGKVILSTRADDKNPSTADFANAVVGESITSRLTGDLYNFPAGSQRGPIAYYAPKSVDLNPPGLNLFAVVRGFPRKHRLTAYSVLTVQ